MRRVERPGVLVGLVAIALALAFGRAAGRDPDGASGPLVEPVAPQRAESGRTGGALATAMASRHRRNEADAVADLFSGRSWLPPPPMAAPAPAPAPPPAPTVPPLPYAYVGRLDSQDAKPVVYLSRGELLVEARAGELLDPEWRVESLTAEELVLVFVPLGRPQVLRIGNTP